MTSSASSDTAHQWLCFQIGAREHYAIPRMLHDADKLEMLVTDYWAENKFTFTKNLQGRRHDEIPNDKVMSFNTSNIGFEVLNKINRSAGWELVMERNEWFQKKSVNWLKSLKINPSHVFSYSYAAKEIFRYAKSKGWVTVLGQIDPGPLEEEIVSEELNAFPQYESEWQPALQKYWDNWHEECELADKIIVNSEWSYNALIQKGISKNKIQIVPLSYSPSVESRSFHREYPLKFDKERPLQVLFLGQVILRKGIARVIEAAQLMLDKPVEFTVAGPAGIQPLPEVPNLKWIGKVPRLEVNNYFKKADVFLFPTLSDGFGLTQLEARAWQLPLIVSKNCGMVVNDQCDGWVLNEVSGDAIEKIIDDILKNPSILSAYSSRVTDNFVTSSIIELIKF